jgi:protein involved in polysaccharide export with SLBB domain
VEILGTETEIMSSAIIHVDISGAVTNPGVYQFTDNTLIDEALKRVGGLSREADVI